MFSVCFSMVNFLRKMTPLNISSSEFDMKINWNLTVEFLPEIMIEFPIQCFFYVKIYSINFISYWKNFNKFAQNAKESKFDKNKPFVSIRKGSEEDRSMISKNLEKFSFPSRKIKKWSIKFTRNLEPSKWFL